LNDVREIYKSTTLKYPVCSLLPPKYRHYLEAVDTEYDDDAPYGTDPYDFVEILLRLKVN
jgi:hypothetical protein